MRVYLDHNATTPLRAEARDAIVAAMDVVGNPSSVHQEGRAAKSALERARQTIASAFGADGAEVVFTSSATEAAALALRGRDIMGSPEWQEIWAKHPNANSYQQMNARFMKSYG